VAVGHEGSCRPALLNMPAFAGHTTGRADFPHPAFSCVIKPSHSAGQCADSARRRGRASHRDTRPDTGDIWCPLIRCVVNRLAKGPPYWSAGVLIPRRNTRLRPTGQDDRVELLYRSLWKERWTKAGPFGRTALPLDQALTEAEVEIGGGFLQQLDGDALIGHRRPRAAAALR
jgi:hypothetical protein